MRVVNQKKETITEYDLSKGKLYPIRLLKENVQPIDNKTKFVYTKNDFENAKIYIPNKEKSSREKIIQLKKQLSSTDYKIIKCSECQLLGEPMPYDVVTLHAERQAIRDKINELEAQLCQS